MLYLLQSPQANRWLQKLRGEAVTDFLVNLVKLENLALLKKIARIPKLLKLPKCSILCCRRI